MMPKVASGQVGNLSYVRTLGIDPGLNTTGYAVVETRGGRIELIEAGVVRGRQRGSLPGRLK